MRTVGSCHKSALSPLFVLAVLSLAAEEPVSVESGKETEKVVVIQVDPKLRSEIEELIPSLGHTKYEVRNATMEKLISMGDPAAEVLSAFKYHRNPEIRQLINLIRIHIKWKISTKLNAELGDFMTTYEDRLWEQRQRVIVAIGFIGKEEVIPTLIAIIRHDPDTRVKQTAIAALYKMGEAGIAALIEAGIDIDGLEPHYVDIFISLGNRYLTDGKYDKAEAQYLKALKTDPKNPIAAYNMACTYSLKEELKASLDWLEKAVEFGFDDFTWMQEDPDLKNLLEEARFKEIVRLRGRGKTPLGDDGFDLDFGDFPDEAPDN
ncbi:MAG: HEAT repeat domain-containing protein [Planctomycetota bacterium]|nr:HEAT repeat domain-containing protein [Planctomycetota bacterium]